VFGVVGSKVELVAVAVFTWSPESVVDGTL